MIAKRRPTLYIAIMSAQEIIAELGSLTPKERRLVARRIFEMDDEAQILADCDRRADENFQILDRMETEDAARKAR
jgi:hypothetical protein